MVVSTVSALAVAHLGEHAGLESSDGELGGLPRSALGAAGHGLSGGPLAVGAALEAGAVNAVPLALGGAGTGLGTGGTGGALLTAGSGLSGSGSGGLRGGSEDTAGGSGGRHSGSRSGGGGSGSGALLAGALATGALAAGALTARATGGGGVARATERRSTGAGLAALGGQVGLVSGELDDLTRVGEADVLALGGGAAVDVGNEHVGEAGSALGGRALGGGAALDSDGRAVHVHLAVSDAVEPGPGEGVLAGLDALGDGVLEGSSPGAVGVLGKVAVDVGGTSTLDGLDDHPLGVLGGLHILGQGDLAGATTVDGGALEAQRVVLADVENVLLRRSGVDTGALLAGEVAAVRLQRGVVEGGLAVGVRRAHEHVSLDGGGTQKGGNETGLGEHFVEG